MHGVWSLVFLPLVAASQPILTPLGNPINLIAPATNADGSRVVFAAATAPDGTAQKGTNAYLYVGGSRAASIHQLTNYTGTTTLTGVTAIAYATGLAAYAALPAGPGGAEEVHLIDTISARDRILATDTQGCVQPMCANCFRACVGPVHLSPDAGKVLYAVARQQPFHVVNADGSGSLELPVYLGQLAPSSQRVISRAGTLVFTSASPSGPTFAAAATDVYLIGLDGTGLRQVTKFGNSRMFAANATISDDGALIAFESNYSVSGPGDVSQIWLTRSDGTGLRQLSAGPDNASNPSISADGATVVFVQGDRIKRVKTSGDGTPLDLTDLSISAARFPALSDDGTRVVFTMGPQFGSPAAVYGTGTNLATDPRTFESIYVPRVVNAGGVTSAAGYGPPTPGSLISVYGANLGLDELAQAGGFPLPKALHELSLLVNGEPVPMLAATPWQINAQLPQTVQPGTAMFQLVYENGVRLPAVSAEVMKSSPAVLAYPFVRDRLYYSQAAAFHAGTAIAADMDHPAAAAEILEMFGLGLGITDPVVEAGAPSPAAPPVRAAVSPRVRIGGLDAAVTFSGLAPGLAGVYQVNAIVPAGLRPGLQIVTWLAPDSETANSSIAVK